MNPIAGAGGTGSSASRGSSSSATPPDLGSDAEPSSFVAAAVRSVIRARHAVADMAYFVARDNSTADVCVPTFAQSDV